MLSLMIQAVLAAVSNNLNLRPFFGFLSANSNANEKILLAEGFIRLNVICAHRAR